LAPGDWWDYRSWATFPQEAWGQTKGIGIRFGSGLKEGVLIGGDMLGYHWADGFGYGQYYEGRSKLYKAMTETPEDFGPPDELRVNIIKGTGKEVVNIATLGFYRMAESHGEAWATGDWDTAQDRSLQAVFLTKAAKSMLDKGKNPYGLKGVVEQGSVFSKILGTAQSTGTRGHSFVSKVVAYWRALNPRVEKVTMDLGYKQLLGPRVLPNARYGPRPDVAALYKNGFVRVTEVASKTDNLTTLKLKNVQFLQEHGIPYVDVEVSRVAQFLNTVVPK
jgi:hypothetical protein